MPSEAKLAHKLQPFNFEALGTSWWILADVDEEALAQCVELANDFQHTYSRFEETSLTNTLNKQKVLIDPPGEFRDLLTYGIEAALRSGGLFNLTAGAQLAQRGYGALAHGDFVADWTNKVEVSEDRIVIADDITIDFGGFGKGWLVDTIHDFLVQQGANNVLVNGGGDIRLTQSTPYEIPLMKPGDDTQYFATVATTTGSFASSSPLVRAWGEHNHLVDTHGQSYDGNITQLTVYSPLARDADMSATACIISADPFKTAGDLGVDILATYKNGRFKATKKFPLKKA